MRTESKCCISVLLGVLSCATHVPPATPGPASIPTDGASARCREARKFAERAEQLRKNHRALRAELYEERARGSCASLQPRNLEVASSTPSKNALEDVYRWLARKDPMLFLRTERLADEATAMKIEASVRDLEMTLGKKLTVDIKLSTRAYVAPLMQDWVTFGAATLAKEGEWFERFVLPECTTNWVVGPFSSSIAICGNELKNQESYLVIDLNDGKVLATRAVGQRSGSDENSVPPIALDEDHFALIAGNGTCTVFGGDEQSNMACEPAVEIWQTSPLKRLKLFYGVQFSETPIPELLGASKPVAQSRSCGQAKRSRDCASIPDDFESRVESAMENELKSITRLGSGLLAISNRVATLLVDWRTLKEQVVLPGTDTAISPSDRFVAFKSTDHELGLYDRKSGKARILPAPELTDFWPPQFSRDDRRIVSGGNRGLVYLWTTENGRIERTFEVPIAKVQAHPAAGDKRGVPDADHPVTPVEISPDGKSLFVSEASSLHEFQLETGQEIPRAKAWAVRWRRDGSAFLLSDLGCVTEELGSGQRWPLADCPKRRSIWANSHDGEWLLRQWSRKVQDAYYYSLELVSTRDNRVAASWPIDDDTRASPFAYFTASDSHILVSGGPVIERSGLRVVWPRTGLPGFNSTLEVNGSEVRLAKRTTLDVSTGHVQFDAPKEPPFRTPTADANPCAPRLGHFPRAGNFELRCDYNTKSFVLCRNSAEIARIPGCAGVMALSPAGTSAMLQHEQGLTLLNLVTKQEHPWLPALLRNEHIHEIYLGYRDEAFVVSRAESLLWTAWLFPKGKDQPAWKRVLPSAPERIRFSSDRAHSMVLGRMDKALYGWDLSSGEPRGYWPHSDPDSDFGEYGDLNLLAFRLNGGIGFSRFSPPASLFEFYLDEAHRSAIVLAPDGRFELIGDHEIAARDLRCRVGHRVLPTSACAERFEWPGLLKELLSELGVDRDAGQLRL